MSQGTGLSRHVIGFPGDFRGLDEMNVSHFAADAVIYNFASLFAWLDRISGRVPPVRVCNEGYQRSPAQS
jgi:hypothetical protein